MYRGSSILEASIEDDEFIHVPCCSVYVIEYIL